MDLTQIHPGQIVTESLRAFDQGLEPETVIRFPRRYQVTFNGQTKAQFFHQISEVQAYCI